MKTIIIGAGGHSRVVYDTVRHDPNVETTAFVDNSPRGSKEKIMRTRVEGDHSVIPELRDEGVSGFIVAVGDNEIRQAHFETYRDQGLTPVNAVHPEAHVIETVSLGEGNVVTVGSILSTNVSVGDNAIINTGSVVEHETTVGDHVHIGPGCTVAGRVEIGDRTFIGMGSSIKEYTTIGENAVVGAGSVVLDDVPPNTMVAGTPAEVKQKRTDDQ